MTRTTWRTSLDLARPVRIGPIEIPARGLLMIPGLVVWLLIAGLLTGFDNTVDAFVANAGFVAGLVLIATLTRTISVLTVVRAFLLGATAMAIMLLLAQPLTGVSREPSTGVDPVAEELLKLGPLAILFWQGRKRWIWQVGATDILLIGVAAGAGFAVVEDAYIRLNEGWGDTLPFLPTTEIYQDRIRGDRLIPGHAIWTALSAATIGLAWLMARSRPALLIAPLGLLVVTANHVGVNSNTWTVLGPLVIVLFVAVAVAVIALDLYVLTRKLPPVPQLDAALAQPMPPLARWRRQLESRRLRFAAWRLSRKPGVTGGAGSAIRSSLGRLIGAGVRSVER